MNVRFYSNASPRSTSLQRTRRTLLIGSLLLHCLHSWTLTRCLWRQSRPLPPKIACKESRGDGGSPLDPHEQSPSYSTNTRQTRNTEPTNLTTLTTIPTHLWSSHIILALPTHRRRLPPRPRQHPCNLPSHHSPRLRNRPTRRWLLRLLREIRIQGCQISSGITG
jgi:hypothetical protein